MSLNFGFITRIPITHGSQVVRYIDVSLDETTIGIFNMEFQDLDLLTWCYGPFTMGKFINSRNEMEIRFPVLFMEQFQKVKYFWNQKNIAHFIKK